MHLCQCMHVVCICVFIPLPREPVGPVDERHRVQAEAQSRHHVSLHLANATDRAGVICALRKDLDSRYENFLDLGRKKDCRDADQLQVLRPVQLLNLLEEFVAIGQCHVECGLLEPHVGAELGHPAKQSHSHQLVYLILPAEVVHAQATLELFQEHFFIEVLIEAVLLNFQFFLSQRSVDVGRLLYDQLLGAMKKETSVVLAEPADLPGDHTLGLLA